MIDELGTALEKTLDVRLRYEQPAPNLPLVRRRGMRRRRQRRVTALAGVAACIALAVSIPRLDLWPRTDEGRRHSVASGVERVGQMMVPRAAHAATLLDNGRVLISGGFSGDSEIYYDSTELFDPATGVFTPSGPMTTARTGHASVLLDDGKVLVAGGWGGDFLSSAELYDPTTGLFSATGSMSTTRDGFTATKLQDGRVLVIGGFKRSYDTFNKSVEIYDPATGKFTPTGSLHRARASHTATILPDGRVVVAGGLGPDGVLRSIEVYDPARGRFYAAGRMAVGRQKHGAALLDSGKILFFGGANIHDFQGRRRSAEVYNPATGLTKKVGAMSEARYKVPPPINLPGRRILVVGGADNAELYKERRKRFITVDGDLTGAHSFPTSTVLADGSVLITGGYDQTITATASAWLFHP